MDRLGALRLVVVRRTGADEVGSGNLEASDSQAARAPANRAILTTLGIGVPLWNKNWSAMTGSMLPAAYTTRSARSIRIDS